jgi:hypothetical protein
MPRISQFYGIAIYQYYRDHPPPHFHAIYGEFEAVVAIETADIAEGKLPRRARLLVEEWAAMHREELLHNWELARQGQPLNAIEPLE